MAYYPIMLDVWDKNCIVVGGGKVAYRKIRTLLECRGKVTVIAKNLSPEIEHLKREGSIRVIQRNYEKGDITNCHLVIAASDDRETNRLISAEAQKSNILVNVVDDQERSSFIVPSAFRRGDLTIAIATNGKSPLLARKLREKLEGQIGEIYGELLERLYEARQKGKKEGISLKEKLEIYEKIIEESGLI